MPSGGKKRKAAKKKIKEASDPNSATHSLGGDDLKVHDEKDSDGGESNSPTSQDYHNHQHQFAGGAEEEMDKRVDTPSIRSIVTENEPVVGVDSNGEGPQKMAEEENSVIQIDWALIPEDDSDSKNVCIEYVESVKEPHSGHPDDGSSSSSSSSSSDDKSNFVEKNVVLIESGELKEDATVSVTEAAVSSESVMATDLAEVTQVTEVVPAMDNYTLAVGDPKEEAYCPVAVNAPSVNLVEPTDLPEVTQVTDGVTFIEACGLAENLTDESTPSVVDTLSLVNSEDAYKEAVHPNYRSTVENAVCFNVIESGKMESEKDGNSVASVKPIDLPEVTQVTDGVSFIETYSLAEKSTEEAANLVVDTFSLVNSEDAYKEGVHPNDSSTMENAVCSNVIESGKMENGNDGNSVNSVKPTDLREVTQVTDGVPIIEAYNLAEKSTEEAANSVVDTFSLVNSEDAFKEGAHLNDGSTLENVVCSNVFESGKMENRKTESLGVSPVVMDMRSQLEDKVSSTAVENSAVSLVASAAGFVAHEDEGKPFPSSSTPAADTSSGAEHIKDSKITECSDGQPLVDSAPRPVQTTSWMSCCGLFEVFTGSR